MGACSEKWERTGMNRALLSGFVHWMGWLGSLGLLAMAQPAHSEFRIGGFGTVGYSVLADSETKTGGTLEEFSGVTSKGTMRNLTRFGLNFTKDISDNAMITVQFIASGADLFHGTDDRHQFRLYSNLAGIRFEVEDYAFLVGLIPTSNFIISDLIQVGYSYLYSQPPKGYYRFADVESLAGFRGSRYFELGSLYINAILTMGEVLYHKTVEDNSTYNTRSSYTYSLVLENEYQNHFFRAGYILFPAFRHSRRFKTFQNIQGNDVEMVAVGSCANSDMTAWGIAYRGTYFDDFEILAEMANREIQTLECSGALEKSEKLRQYDRASYVSLSYALGKFTPRLGYAVFDRSIDTEEATAHATRAIPDGPVRVATRAAIDKELQARVAQTGYSLTAGLNYQINSQIILKTEMERFFAPDDTINGYYMPAGSTATIFNVSLDYVF